MSAWDKTCHVGGEIGTLLSIYNLTVTIAKLRIRVGLTPREWFGAAVGKEQGSEIEPDDILHGSLLSRKWDKTARDAETAGMESGLLGLACRGLCCACTVALQSCREVSGSWQQLFAFSIADCHPRVSRISLLNSSLMFAFGTWKRMRTIRWIFYALIFIFFWFHHASPIEPLRNGTHNLTAHYQMETRARDCSPNFVDSKMNWKSG